MDRGAQRRRVFVTRVVKAGENISNARLAEVADWLKRTSPEIHSGSGARKTVSLRAIEAPSFHVDYRDMAAFPAGGRFRVPGVADLRDTPYLRLQPEVFFHTARDRASLDDLALAAKCAPELDFQKISTVLPSSIRRARAHVC